MKKHKGMTLLETLAAITIMAILGAMGASAYSSMVLDGNIQTVSTTLQNYTSNIEDGFFNIGYPEWTSGEDAETEILAFLYEMEDDYLNFSFDYDSFSQFDFTDYWGFSITTSPETDPWGTPYKWTYKLSNTAGLEMMIASKGPDGQWSEQTTSYYQTGDYGDDILMVITLR